MEAMFEVMNRALSRRRLRLPNSLFVLSVADNDPRFCRPEKNCTLPILGVSKGAGEGKGLDTDILVPGLNWYEEGLYVYPWELKEKKGG